MRSQIARFILWPKNRLRMAGKYISKQEYVDAAA